MCSLKLLFLVLTAACVLPFAPTSSSFAAAQARDKPQKISAKKLTKNLEQLCPSVHYGGVMISTGDTLRGPVVAVDGALDIQDRGVLDGDAWIVNGRLILTGGAVALGRIHLVNSEVFRSRVAEVTGGIGYYTSECRLDADKLENEGRLIFSKYEDPLAVKIKPKVTLAEPTRVKYNVLRVGVERRNPRHPAPHVEGHALIDVPYWSHARGFLGFDAEVSVPVKGDRVTLLARGFKSIETNDDWQLSRRESSGLLSAVGFELSDYFERRGAELGIEFVAGEYFDIRTFVSYAREVSLATDDAPSLFQSNQRLRENPSIDDGDRLNVSGEFVYDSRADRHRPQNAWRLGLLVEKGIADGPGDFSYTAFEIDMRRYARLPMGLQWDTRAKLFSTFDRAPRQVFRSLNGYGGVRGLSDDPFAVRRGDRLALFSAELRRRLPSLPVFSALFSRWSILIFTDIGLLTETKKKDSPLDFLETSFDDWGKTAGIGISGESFLPYVGVYVAKDLDGDRKSPRIILRFSRSF